MLLIRILSLRVIAHVVELLILIHILRRAHWVDIAINDHNMNEHYDNFTGNVNGHANENRNDTGYAHTCINNTITTRIHCDCMVHIIDTHRILTTRMLVITCVW